MRPVIVSALLALSAAFGPAAASTTAPPATTIQCITVSGRDEPALCKVPPGRLDRSEYICTCPAGGQRVEVAVCAKGQKPPPSNLALDRVRREAARDGSLLGDTVDGRPICVAPRKP